MRRGFEQDMDSDSKHLLSEFGTTIRVPAASAAITVPQIKMLVRRIKASLQLARLCVCAAFEISSWKPM